MGNAKWLLLSVIIFGFLGFILTKPVSKLINLTPTTKVEGGGICYVETGRYCDQVPPQLETIVSLEEKEKRLGTLMILNGSVFGLLLGIANSSVRKSNSD